MLSIYTFTEVIGHCFKAVSKFFTMFAAIWRLTSSRLEIDVLRFEILDLDVSSPFTKSVECSITAMVTAEHFMLLASAKTWSHTAFILLMFLATLLGTVMFLS